MSSKTNMKYGDPQAMFTQAAGVFATHSTRRSTMNRLTGKMPRGTSGAEATIRNQTTQHMPIVRAEDLGKGRGDEVTFNLINPVGGYPIMGSEYAEGRGVGIDTAEDRLRVDQARFPLDLGNQMSTIRSPVEFRNVARPLAQAMMDDYVDQSLLVHMAGARGFHDNIEWRVPVNTHEKFNQIMVNRVKAPTKNRHFMASSAHGLETFGASAGEVQMDTTDLFSMKTVDSVRNWIDQIALPPPPVKFDGDEAAEDSPLRVMLVSPAQYNLFAQDPSFRAFQGNALQRASNAKNHPLFRGDVGLWNGVLIVKQNRPIRFYAGDPIAYSLNHTSEQEDTAIVPASFTDKFAVDRAILLGGQAVAEALAKSDKTGIPFFWSEKELDHGDKCELLIGAIRGVSKIRFAVNTGEGVEFTDYGATAIDTVVPIIGARK